MGHMSIDLAFCKDAGWAMIQAWSAVGALLGRPTSSHTVSTLQLVCTLVSYYFKSLVLESLALSQNTDVSITDTVYKISTLNSAYD